MKKVFSLMIALAALASYSTPVFADEGTFDRPPGHGDNGPGWGHGDHNPGHGDNNPGWGHGDHNPGWGHGDHNPGWGHGDHNPGWGRGGTVCFARNIAGQTFQAMGDWRMPEQFVARRAIQECRYNSGFFLGRTCRFLGCRSTGGGWGGGWR